MTAERNAEFREASTRIRRGSPSEREVTFAKIEDWLFHGEHTQDICVAQVLLYTILQGVDAIPTCSESYHVVERRGYFREKILDIPDVLKFIFDKTFVEHPSLYQLDRRLHGEDRKAGRRLQAVLSAVADKLHEAQNW